MQQKADLMLVFKRQVLAACFQAANSWLALKC